MEAGGADGGEAALWGIGLVVVVVPFGDSPALDRTVFAQAAGVEQPRGEGGEAALRGVALPVVVSSPTLARAVLAQAAGVQAAGADGGEAKAGGGFVVFGQADRDLGAAQPAVGRRVGREVALGRRDPLPIGGGECEFDPAVGAQASVDAADRGSPDLYGAAPQPAIVSGIGREVARARQDALPAARLPAEFDAAVIKESRDDAAGILLVVLRLGGRCEVGGDDRGDGG